MNSIRDSGERSIVLNMLAAREVVVRSKNVSCASDIINLEDALIIKRN